MLSKVSSTRRMSCVLAPLTAMPKGIPAPSVSNDRLVPDLPRSVGFGPVFPPTERSLRHGPVDALPFPLDAFEFVVFLQGQLPEFGEDALCDQQLEVAVQAASRPELRRRGFPLTAGSQHIEDPVEDRPPLQRLASWMSSPTFAARQPRIEALPECIRDAPVIIDTRTFHC